MFPPPSPFLFPTQLTPSQRLLRSLHLRRLGPDSLLHPPSRPLRPLRLGLVRRLRRPRDRRPRLPDLLRPRGPGLAPLVLLRRAGRVRRPDIRADERHRRHEADAGRGHARCAGADVGGCGGRDRVGECGHEF